MRRRDPYGPSAAKRQRVKSRKPYAQTKMYSAVRKKKGEPAKTSEEGISVYNVDSTGFIALRFTIPVGAGPLNARIGRELFIRSIQVRGSLEAGTTASVAHARMIVVYDRRPTGILPTYNTVMSAIAPTAFINSANYPRFRILLNKGYAVTGQNALGNRTDQSYFVIDEYVKVKDIISYKNANTGTIDDIEQGAVYILWVADTAAGTASPIARVAMRMRYDDN